MSKPFVTYRVPRLGSRSFDRMVIVNSRTSVLTQGSVTKRFLRRFRTILKLKVKTKNVDVIISWNRRRISSGPGRWSLSTILNTQPVPMRCTLHIPPNECVWFTNRPEDLNGWTVLFKMTMVVVGSLIRFSLVIAPHQISKTHPFFRSFNTQ